MERPRKGPRVGTRGGPRGGTKRMGPEKAQGRESPGPRGPNVTSVSLIIAAVIFFVLLLSCFL